MRNGDPGVHFISSDDGLSRFSLIRLGSLVECGVEPPGELLGTFDEGGDLMEARLVGVAAWRRGVRERPEALEFRVMADVMALARDGGTTISAKRNDEARALRKTAIA